jgi:hypothetical protein
VSILCALACLTMEGPARRNSGKLSSNQPVFRFSRKGAGKRFQAKWMPDRAKKTPQTRI